uniref:Variable large protein n=1 Tax=Borrelia garinii subsp. bavariensis (strain ATCC BAA-2496 / DSM 23469 / PBi) TaxID=290434 RepID=A0A7I6GXQ8_BORGP|nr:hypothetical protein BGP223 [Borreliella bavariensis PBi]
MKTYFDSITKTLKDTKTKLEDISKEKTGGEKTPAVEGIAEVVKTVGEWLDGLIKAAEGGGKAADGGGSDKIGNVAAGGGAGANANKESVNGIAGAIKGIVEAAKKVEGVKFEPKAADADGNKKAGKLFGTAAAGAGAEDVKDAAAAVGAVSGEQILNAIVTAAGKDGQDGKAAGDAKNAIEAAIGAAGGDAADFGDGIKKKNDQIAAALVLRGVAKDGKFAGAADNKKAGKLFGTAAVGADAEDVKDAAAAVGAVSGEQILNAIVTAAGQDGQDGKAAGQAKNAIEAAIGAGGGDKIGNVAGAGGGAGANKESVNGIAGAIKGIVEAAKKVEGVKFEPTATADAAAADGNKKAGKLFGTAAGGGQAAAEDVKDAAAAVGAVSGEQILNAIVTAAGQAGQAGKKADEAKNAIEAAIGAAGGAAAEFGNDIKKKNDQIAAALVLRGVAKDGKFAGADNETEKVKAVVESAVVKVDDNGGKAADGGGSDKIGNVAAGAGGANADKESVNRIAGAIKGIVKAAKKVEGVKFEPTKAADADNKKAGKLFGNAGADAGDVKDAAAAVGAVSGEQILNAIVTAAGQDGQDGKAAGDAKNAIEAAIGAGAAADFGDGNDKIGKKNDQIAAALVLRGVAKSGKFAGANNETEKVKAVVESAVVKTFGEWLDGLIKAAEGGGKAADGGGDKIGNVDAAGGAGANANKESVNGIAGAIKGIVEAAKKVEGVKFEPTKAADADNKKAGKLFGNAAAGAEDVNKAAAAVGAVSGEQILNAIVTAAGQDGQDGKAAGDAKNAIEAAIGGAGAAADFGDGNDKIGKKNDQIAAALVLRGVAKSGKFAGANNETEKVKAVVESAVVKVDDNGGKAADGGGSDKIGNVDAAGAGAGANKESVNGIAGAIKGIVEAAKKVEGVKFEPKAAADAADGAGNKKAGKLFGTAAGADAGDVKDAAAAVGAVSGEQILNAIVTAAGKDGQDGQAAGQAKNAIEAAIGDGDAADFGNDIKKKNDQIAAALVLRGGC